MKQPQRSTQKPELVGYPLRMPADLYEQVRVLADQQDISVNSLLVRLVAEAIDWTVPSYYPPILSTPTRGPGLRKQHRGRTTRGAIPHAATGT